MTAVSFEPAPRRTQTLYAFTYTNPRYALHATVLSKCEAHPTLFRWNIHVLPTVRTAAHRRIDMTGYSHTAKGAKAAGEQASLAIIHLLAK